MNDCRINLIISAALPLLALLGCAGPTSPLGAISLYSLFSVSDRGLRFSILGSDSGVNAAFEPNTMVLHRAQDLTLHVTDSHEIRPGYRLKVFYNLLDVSDSFFKMATFSFSKERTDLRVVMPHVSLDPGETHAIQATYRGTSSFEAKAILEKPSCDISKMKTQIADEDFNSARSFWNEDSNRRKVEYVFHSDANRELSRLIAYSSYDQGATARAFFKEETRWDQSSELKPIRSKAERLLSRCAHSSYEEPRPSK